MCYQNRSGVCLDRSQYTGSKSFTDSALGWSGTCDQFISSAGDANGNRKFANFGFGSGKKLWADASSCSDFTEDQNPYSRSTVSQLNAVVVKLYWILAKQQRTWKVAR